MTSANFDLDRYYTPEDVALSALKQVDLPFQPESCADSSCGNGRLLDAANHVFGEISCIGVDRDRNAIRALKKKRPSWVLSTGDLLSRRSYLSGFGKVIPGKVDLLVLNPPFSQVSQKHIQIEYNKKNFRGSIAMACLTKSLELFRPTLGAVLIAPESLLYSEIDTIGRQSLSLSYSLRKVADLKCSTFKGARANACVVELLRGSDNSQEAVLDLSFCEIKVDILRGSLPVHLMTKSSSGTIFLHSTNIRQVVGSGNVSSLDRTSNTAKGIIRGWCILIPRVGMPDSKSVKTVYFEHDIQLSDCVIALCSRTKFSSLQIEKRIQEHWMEFRELYKGTGARYVTVAHLTKWLSRLNVIPDIR